MNYLSFLNQNWRFLTFGIVLNLFASAGQTYYLSIFGGEFRRDFSLTDGEFGFIYMLATVTSAGSLIWLGRYIDRVELRLYTLLICSGMIAAVFFLSIVHTTIMLGIAFYFLRLTGQGLMNHVAVTSMGRYFIERRGTAISIIAFGTIIGLAVYPILGVGLVSWIGWRGSWSLLGSVYVIVLIPLIIWLLKGQGERHQSYLTERHKTSSLKGQKTIDYSVRSMLREPRFYLMMPAILAPSFLLTGLIFHQVRIVESKGWSMSVFASGYVGLAIASLLTSLVLGPLVDRWRAIKLLPIILAPLALALLILNIFDSDYFGFIYLISLGSSFGATFTVTGAIWPELYGTTNLGAIKSVSKALTVFASAMSPWVFGLLFDAGFGVLEISWLSIVTILVTGVLARISLIFHRL